MGDGQMPSNAPATSSGNEYASKKESGPAAHHHAAKHPGPKIAFVNLLYVGSILGQVELLQHELPRIYLVEINLANMLTLQGDTVCAVDSARVLQQISQSLPGLVIGVMHVID